MSPGEEGQGRGERRGQVGGYSQEVRARERASAKKVELLRIVGASEGSAKKVELLRIVGASEGSAIQQMHC